MHLESLRAPASIFGSCDDFMSRRAFVLSLNALPLAIVASLSWPPPTTVYPHQSRYQERGKRDWAVRRSPLLLPCDDIPTQNARVRPLCYGRCSLMQLYAPSRDFCCGLDDCSTIGDTSSRILPE